MFDDALLKAARVDERCEYGAGNADIGCGVGADAAVDDICRGAARQRVVAGAASQFVKALAAA